MSKVKKVGSVLYKVLDNKEYTILAIVADCTDVFAFVNVLHEESMAKDLNGKVLLDQLLLTGNADNRFVEVPYKDGVPKLYLGKKVEVDEEMRQLSTDMLLESGIDLDNTILSDCQKRIIKNGKPLMPGD